MDREIEASLTLEQFDAMDKFDRRQTNAFARMSPEDRARYFEREEEERKQREAEQIEQWRLARVQQRINSLPKELLHAFDIYKHPDAPAHAKVMEWKTGKLGLMLVGPTGMAKSRSMLQLLTVLIRQDVEIIYWSAPRLADKISALAFESSDKLDAFIKELESVSILAIDDLGAHKPTERVCQEFHRIIDTRYSEGRPLFVTTNCKPAELQKQLLDEHGRTIRRLQQMTQAIQF